MNKDEQILQEHFGKKNPFKVPEGYFDSFPEKLMEQLPEKQVRKAKVVRMNRFDIRLWRAISVAAVTICAVVIGATYYLGNVNGTNSSSVAVDQPMISQSSSDDFDEMADYMMADNADFYAYVADY